MLILLVESQRLLAVLEYEPKVLQTVFASLCDPSILCGLLIVLGGVLILLGNNALGAATGIIFGFFPPVEIEITNGLKIYGAYHTFDVIKEVLNGELHYNYYATVVLAVVGGSLPILGGLLALIKNRRIHW